MFGNCCNTCCPADSNRGLFGICLNDATLVIILLAIWLLSSGGLSGYGGGETKLCVPKLWRER